MTTLYHDRPFNVRYPVQVRTGTYTPELLQTHRTAKASYLYINRLRGIDDFGPTPDWSARNDLVAFGRCAPQRTGDPSSSGGRRRAGNHAACPHAHHDPRF